MPAEISLPWIEPLLPSEYGYVTKSISFSDESGSRFTLTPGMPCDAVPVRALLRLPREGWHPPLPLMPGQNNSTAVSLCLRAVPRPDDATGFEVFADTLNLHELPALAPTTRIHQSAVANAPLRVMRMSAQVRAGRTATRLAQAVDRWLRRHHVDIFGSSAQTRGSAGHGTKPPPKFWPRAVPSGVYVGFEFEAQFHGTQHRENALRAIWGMNDSMIPPVRGNTIADRHVYIESDSSLTSPAAEIITMPHMIRQPSTYVALLRLFSCICANGAHNVDEHCGMHMHLSRTAFTHSDWGGRRIENTPTQGTVAFTMDRMLQAILTYLNGTPGFMAFSGRSGISNYASPSNGINHRFRHINWANTKTVEFRFFGPYNFAKPDWPCIAHDIVLALLATARAVHAPNVTRATQEMRVGLQHVHSPVPYGRHALRCFKKVLESAPDLYPFAFEHFFVKSDTPPFLREA